MRKEIFESEEEMTEYHEYMRKCCGKISCSGMKCRKCKIATAKEAGLIKQNPVEKAEKMFHQINITLEVDSFYRLTQNGIDVIINSHEYQKKQLEDKNDA